MNRNAKCLQYIRQLVLPLPGHVRTVHQQGKQPLAWGKSSVHPWTNEVGRESLRRIMPDLMKVSRERRDHLWDGKKSIAPSHINADKVAQPVNDLNETRDLAEVPSFARFAEFRKVDLNFEQAKLHVAWRCAAMVGRPRYEKDIMIELKLDSPIHRMVILKNTPEINYKLWMVKHLIRIKPLIFPDGIPDEKNFRGFLLKHNGELVQSRLLRDNYKRARNRPELERYVFLREEQESGMRRKWNHGSVDGTLLPTVAIDQRPTHMPHRLSYSRLGKGCTSCYSENDQSKFN